MVGTSETSRGVAPLVPSPGPTPPPRAHNDHMLLLQAAPSGPLFAGGGVLTSPLPASHSEHEGAPLSLDVSGEEEGGRYAPSGPAAQAKPPPKCSWDAPRVLILGEPGDR
jgi:hypothetical protein